MVETNDVPLYERRVPFVNEEALLPPLPIGKIPKMLLAEKVEVAETTPEALVCKNPDGDPEIVRFVVDAVEKYPVPLAVKLVVDAPPLKIWRALQVLAVVVPKPKESVTAPVAALVSKGYEAAIEVTPLPAAA